MTSVSIIITNHNYGRFLPHAIESALAQTHDACEVVVIDDGSTDDSRDVIAHYGDVTAVLQDNRGQAAAFNAGFAHASGDVVIFLDADDVLEPDIAAVVAGVVESDAAVAKVMYRLRVIDADGAATGELKPPAHLPLRSGDLRPYVLRFPFDMTWMATSGNAFRTAVLGRIFPIPESDYGGVGADWYVSHLTPLLGDVVFLDDVGGSYRVHGANSYERRTGSVDLDQLRQTIIYCRRTARHIVEVARRTGLQGRPQAEDEILCVSELWQRIVSLRLDPGRHPVPGDRRWKLLVLGLRAAAGRCDVTLPMRVLLGGWVLATAVVPRRGLRPLIGGITSARATTRIDRVLGRLHR